MTLLVWDPGCDFRGDQWVRVGGPSTEGPSPTSFTNYPTPWDLSELRPSEFHGGGEESTGQPKDSSPDLTLVQSVYFVPRRGRRYSVDTPESREQWERVPRTGDRGVGGD